MYLGRRPRQCFCHFVSCPGCPRLKPPDKTQLPTGWFKRSAFKLVHSRRFEVCILVIIGANVTLMAATWYNEPPLYAHAKSLANIVFVSIFVAEALLKIYAMGWKAYFKVAMPRAARRHGLGAAHVLHRVALAADLPHRHLLPAD
jgi:hypothetical protein